MRLSTPPFLPCGRIAKPAEGRRSTGSEPEPICDLSATMSTVTGSCARALQRRQQALGQRRGSRLPARVSRRSAVTSFGQAVGVAVEAQHGFQRGQGQLADAQRALQRILLDLRDQVLAADQQAGLRPAEQLVAGEGDEVGAGGDGFRAASVRAAGPSAPGRSACRCRGRRRRASRVHAPDARVPLPARRG